MSLDSKIPAGKMDEKWTDYKGHVKLVNPANKRKLEIIVVGETGLADRASVPWPLLAGGESGCAGVGSLTPWWLRLLCGNRESGADERTPVPPALRAH